MHHGFWKIWAWYWRWQRRPGCWCWIEHFGGRALLWALGHDTAPLSVSPRTTIHSDILTLLTIGKKGGHSPPKTKNCCNPPPKFCQSTLYPDSAFTLDKVWTQGPTLAGEASNHCTNWPWYWLEHTKSYNLSSQLSYTVNYHAWLTHPLWVKATIFNHITSYI